jgi:hypothetical protein
VIAQARQTDTRLNLADVKAHGPRGNRDQTGNRRKGPTSYREERPMDTYSFGIPDFHIAQIRSAHTDTLFASTALRVTNANGNLHHDWGSQTVGLGDHKAGEDWPLELIWTNVDVPDPTPDNPDGGAVYWTFLLVNNGHHDSGYAAVANKAMDAFASKMADGVFQGGTVTLVSLSGLIALWDCRNCSACSPPTATVPSRWARSPSPLPS